MKKPLPPEDAKEELKRHLEMLRRSLAANEEDWAARGLATIRNPVAEGIRRDIAEKEGLLAAF